MTHQNFSNYHGLNSLTLPNARITGVRIAWLAGDTATKTTYTCPADKRALCLVPRLWNYNASSNVISHRVTRVGGSALQFGSDTVGISAASNSTANTERMLLNPGDLFTMTPSTDSAAAYFQVIEFDPLPLAPKGINVNGIAIGENTIYTCPTGYRAVVVHPFGSRSLTSADIPNVYCINRGAGSATVYISLVRSGGSPSSANRIIINTSVAVGAIGVLACPAILNAGDFISLNSTIATANFSTYLSVLELPV